MIEKSVNNETLPQQHLFTFPFISLVLDYQSIIAPIQKSLQEVEQALSLYLQTDLPLIQTIGNYITQKGGKRIRPACLLACYRCFEPNKPPDPVIIKAAVAFEYIHTASLLHDDVIDNTDIRRNQQTANKIWGNEAAVLVGDYLFARAFSILTEAQNTEVLRQVTDCSLAITKGEIYQLTRSYKSASEEEYLQIIRWKTASLIASAMVVGGKLANQSEQSCAVLYSLGEKLGIAYQIIDDVLDYDYDNPKKNKSTGTDLQERKITLPLSHLLQQTKASDREVVLNILNKEHIDQADFLVIYALMQQYQSLVYATNKAQSIVQEIKNLLQEQFAAFDCSLLLGIAEFTIERRL